MEKQISKETKRFGITSAGLHILAMLLMLSDHLWANFFLSERWMTSIGRIAFPIFAFMIAEGFFRTSNRWKYIRRMVIFAVIAEIPFDLGVEHSFFYPFHQNVMFTFVLAMLAMMLIEAVRNGFEKVFRKAFMKEGKAVEAGNVSGAENGVGAGNIAGVGNAVQKGKLPADILTVVVTLILTGLIFIVAFGLGMITFVDYYGFGVLAVLCLYLAHPRNLDNLFGRFFEGGLESKKTLKIVTTVISMILQIILLYSVFSGLGGYCYMVHIFGMEIEIVEELLALIALIPIWLYNGKKGYSAKWFKYFNYLFYPAHLLIIYLITLIV